jgi:hypothetical protein
MKNFKAILFSVLILLIFGLNGSVIKAQGQISFSPTQIIVRENELGKRYTITITNTSDVEYTLSVEEKNAKITDNNLELLETEVALKRLEIPVAEFKVKANDKYELVVRAKIFTNESFESFPSLVIKEKINPQSQTTAQFQTIIPFIIQNTKGESKIESTFTINAQNYSIDPKIIVLGTIENRGTKFSSLSGTIVIMKNGIIIDEQEITSQISGLLFPNESRNYSTDWTISQDFFDGLGEYTIESRVNNDETSNSSIMRISFIYIPKNLIIASLGTLIGIVLLISIISIIKKSKQK